MATGDERIRELTEQENDKLLGTEKHRKRINEIIAEYVGSVEFMKCVREYAGMEIDSRMFRSLQYWFSVVFTAIITSGIGFALALFLT